MTMIRVALAVIVAVAACAPDDDVRARAPGIDVERVLSHVRALGQWGPRVGDTDASRKAADYITGSIPMPVERMPVGEVDLPDIVVLGTTYRRAHRVVSSDPDLIYRFGPAGKYLLFMAHYDSVAGSPGAVDNATAVGALIELARILVANPPPRPVMIAFTANEEIGLVGAEALAARARRHIDLAVALDLIGGSGELSLNGASERIGYAEMDWLARAAERAGVIVRAPLPHRVVSRWWPQAERSDHGPFTRRGVRAIHLYDRGQDGELIDRAYHTDLDVPDRVVPAAVDDLGKLARAMIVEPLAAHDGDALWLPVAVDTVIPRWPLIAGCVLAILATVVLLVRLLRARERGRLGLLAATAGYGIAAVVTFAIERVIAGDHPAPWLHAPLRWTIAELFVFGAVFGLAIQIAGRFTPWVGERRYLAAAAIFDLAIGSAWLFAGAAELAWIWLVPALALALAPSLGRFRILGVVPSALPIALVLAPDQLREAVWNGFMPPSAPLVTWIAILGFPTISGGLWYLRTRGHSGPLGTLALSLGCVLATIVGSLLLASSPRPCTGPQFHAFRLTCELRTEVR